MQQFTTNVAYQLGASVLVVTRLRTCLRGAEVDHELAGYARAHIQKGLAFAS